MLSSDLQRLEDARRQNEVRAPFAGVVGNLSGVIGQQVGPTTQQNPVLATLVADNPMRLDFPIDDRSYLKIRRWLEAQPDKVRAPIGVGVGDEEGYPHPGRAAFRAVQFDESGQCTIHAELPNADHALVAGLSARVGVEFGAPRPTPFVPPAALLPVPSGGGAGGPPEFYQVVTLDDRGVARRRMVRAVPGGEPGRLVRLAPEVGEEAQVRFGVDARTRIVLNPAASNLTNGEAVPADRIEERPPTAISPPARPGTPAGSPR